MLYIYAHRNVNNRFACHGVFLVDLASFCEAFFKSPEHSLFVQKCLSKKLEEVVVCLQKPEFCVVFS